MIPSGIGRCSRIRRDGDSRVWASRDWRPPEDPGTTEVHCNKNRRCVALIRRECCIGYRGFPQGPGRRTHSSLTPVASYAGPPLPYRLLQRLSSRVPSGAHSGVHHLDPSRRNGANGGPDPKPVSRNLGPPNKSVPPGNKLGTGTSPRNKNPVTCNHDRTHLDQSLRSSQKNRNSPTLIAGIPPKGGGFENPRSRNLLHPNESTPTPKQTGWGYSHLAEDPGMRALHKAPGRRGILEGGLLVRGGGRRHFGTLMGLRSSISESR